MFAVISHKGNQHKVEIGKEYNIDLIDSNEDQKKIAFSDVLLVNDGTKNIVGKPVIEGASVEAEILGNISDDKVLVFKFKPKKRYKRTGGHRQSYTLIKVTNISLK